MNFIGFFKSKYRTLGGRISATSRVRSFNKLKTREEFHITSRIRSESTDLLKKLFANADLAELIEEALGPVETLEGNDNERTEEQD